MFCLHPYDGPCGDENALDLKLDSHYKDNMCLQYKATLGDSEMYLGYKRELHFYLLPSVQKGSLQEEDNYFNFG